MAPAFKAASAASVSSFADASKSWLSASVRSSWAWTKVEWGLNVEQMSRKMAKKLAVVKVVIEVMGEGREGGEESGGRRVILAP